MSRFLSKDPTVGGHWTVNLTGDQSFINTITHWLVNLNLLLLLNLDLATKTLRINKFNQQMDKL